MNYNIRVNEFQILWIIVFVFIGVDIYKSIKYDNKGAREIITITIVMVVINFWLRIALWFICAFGILLIIQSVFRSISFKTPKKIPLYFKNYFVNIFKDSAAIKGTLIITILNIFLLLIFQKEELGAFYQKRNYTTHNYIYISYDHGSNLRKVKAVIEVNNWSPKLRRVYFSPQNGTEVDDSFGATIRLDELEEFETYGGNYFLAKSTTETW